MGGLLSIPKFSSGSLKQIIIVLGVIVVFLFVVYVFTSMEAASSGGDFAYSVFGSDLKYGTVEGMAGISLGVRPDYNPPPPPPPPSVPPPVVAAMAPAPASSPIVSSMSLVSTPASASAPTPIAVKSSKTTTQIIQVI